MPLFSGLIKPNATVKVWGLTNVPQDNAGGSVPAYTTVRATDVPVLISLVNGTRDGRFAMRLNNATGTMSGEHSALAQQDTRIEILTGDADLVGLLVEVKQIANHRSSPCGWIPQKISLSWSMIEYVEAA